MEQSSNEAPGFPIVEIALDFLERGDGEKYAFKAEGPEALRSAIELALLAGRNAKGPLDALGGLARVLETEHKSPGAADVIYDVLLDVPDARKRLGLPTDRLATKERTQTFLHGHTASLDAPAYGQRSPRGTLALSAVAPPRTVFR